ncbi:hypothetical protein [Methylibium petroleiphilum]|uniref:Uncharacterized protein n=1 Tax=Methylibium petroleiphilum (strain ATCC BAA-1232 / LMG 22953 / PM1) TaxID=420662 RepID=A2SML0_METPP|nr:hypothetical protein [Methylibium petroleiphilum]ABM96799.1 hypothetical protein Mpe_B0018 [Methylibium petroleiphilum PM1]
MEPITKMELGNLAIELSSAEEEGWLWNGYSSMANGIRQALQVHDEIVLGDIGDGVLQQELKEQCIPIHLHAEITGRQNLVLEWSLTDGRVHPSHVENMERGYWRPQRLIQINATEAVGIRRIDRSSFTHTLAEQRRVARLHDLLVCFTVGVFRRYVADLSAQYVVEACSETPYIHMAHMSSGGLSLDYARRDIYEPKAKLPPIEQLTGIIPRDLLEAAPRLNWRVPLKVNWVQWSDRVSEVGGNRLDELTDSDKRMVLDFYRSNDPKETARARARETMPMGAVARRPQRHHVPVGAHT